MTQNDFPVTPSASSQAVWHINELTGNDTFDGLTANTAIASWNELRKRVGSKWRIEGQIDIYLDSSISNIAPSFSLGVNGIVYVHGKRTILSTGVISAFSADTHLTEATLITATGKTWTPGTLLRTTSGSHPGAWCWIAKDKTGGVARTSEPATIDLPTDAYNTNAVAFAPGDAFQIESQCVVSTASFDVDGAAGLSQNKSMVVFLDCEFTKVEVVGLQPINFVGCKTRFLECDTLPLTNCCMTGVLLSVVNCSSEGGLFLDLFMECLGVWFFNQHPILQNCSPKQKSGSVLYIEDYAGFYDIANPLRVWYGAKIYARHGVYGTGITGDAIQVQAGGQFRWNGTVFSFSGQTNDVTLGGRTQTVRIDPTTNAATGALITTSFTNLLATFGPSGFGGSARDLYSDSSFLQVPDGGF